MQKSSQGSKISGKIQKLKTEYAALYHKTGVLKAEKRGKLYDQANKVTGVKYSFGKLQSDYYSGGYTYFFKVSEIRPQNQEKSPIYIMYRVNIYSLH